MPNLILLAVNQKRLSVAPGASADLAVAVQNLTTLVDQVTVSAEGIDSAWIQVIPQYLPVFAQGTATARVVIQPPRDPARSIAGVYPLRVRGASQEHAGQEGEAAAELEIQLVGDYRFRLEKQTSNGTDGVFAVKVQNDANATLRLNFKGSDDADALWYKFDPLSLQVAPGSLANATLTMRAKQTSDNRQTIVFTVSSQGEYAQKDGLIMTAPARQVSGEFVQGERPRLTISIQPEQIEATEQGVYQIRVGNPGAAPVEVRLAASGSESDLGFVLQPEHAVLSPQSDMNFALTVRAKTQADDQKPWTFRVTAVPVSAEIPSASAQAIFVRTKQAARIPKAFPWIALVLALLAVCLFVAVLVGIWAIILR